MCDSCDDNLVAQTGPPGPIGPQAPLFVSNTVFVDELYGSNTTGAVERRDLPYATRPVALTAAQGMTPTSIKRITIDVANIVSATPLQTSPFIDYNLNGGSIIVTTGATAALDDLNSACDTVIYQANVIKKTGGTNIFGLRTQNAGTVLTIHAKEVTSTVNCGASIEGGYVEFMDGARVTTTAVNENAIEKSGGTLILNSTTLIATGTGSSLFAAAPSQIVKLYGGCQANLNKNANITTQGSILVVSSNII